MSSHLTRNEPWLPDSTQYGRTGLFLIKSSINLPETEDVGQQSPNFFLNVDMTNCDQLGRELYWTSALSNLIHSFYDTDNYDELCGVDLASRIAPCRGDAPPLSAFLRHGRRTLAYIVVWVSDAAVHVDAHLALYKCGNYETKVRIKHSSSHLSKVTTSVVLKVRWHHYEYVP